MASKHLTAADICVGLRKRYIAPEWALLFNVANGTGARQYRYADAIGMSLYPSRGLEIHGFEVKISKSDWKREAADPEKAETIAAYCDRWWVVTPFDLLENENIPPNWGWMSYDGRAFTTKVKAEKTDAKAIDRHFLAALLRRASEANEGLIKAEIAEKTAAIEPEIERRVQRQVDTRTLGHKQLQEAVETFEKASGVKIDTWNGEEIGRAVALVQATGVTNTFNGARRIAEQLRKTAETIDRVFDEAGFLESV